jgi:hypothetical protein
MLRALPILIILGLAVYSFFDVINSDQLAIRRGRRGIWLVVVLVPVLGAGFWFLLGRPSRKRDPNQPPRVINIKGGGQKVAPDDDPRFIRKLDDEAWQRKRRAARAKPATDASADRAPTGLEPPDPDLADPDSEASEGEPEAKEQAPGEKDAGSST